MTGFRLLQLGCISLALNVTPAFADRALRLSTAHLMAEGPSVIVTHDHDVQRVTEPGLVPDRAIGLRLNSTLQIVRKNGNSMILQRAVQPLTALTSVDNGRYFAGLSSLRTLSAEYNFLLISADGEIITTALVTPTSGHCGLVRSTITNFIGWFDEKKPDVRLSFENGRIVRVTVVNPYDVASSGHTGKCTIPVVGAER